MRRSQFPKGKGRKTFTSLDKIRGVMSYTKDFGKAVDRVVSRRNSNDSWSHEIHGELDRVVITARNTPGFLKTVGAIHKMKRAKWIEKGKASGFI